MRLISVKISNILSIEDAYVKFGDSGLVLVQGWNHDVGRANGAGKTAIFNAITYALYDKLPRKITATEILRRGSKAGYVELCVRVGGDQYVVRRSRPKGVLFFKGGMPLTVTQEGFERILGLSYNQFIISMYAPQGASTRFLSISDTEKKQFLLQLLNLEEFSSCKLIADQKVTTLEADVASMKSKMDAIDSKIDAYNESLVDESHIKDSISVCETSIGNFAALIDSAQLVLRPDLSKYQKLEDDISAKRTEFTKVKTKREMLHDQYRKFNSRIRPYVAQKQCVQCGSELDAAAAEAQYQKDKRLLDLELTTIKNQIDECDLLLSKENSVLDVQQKLREKKKEESREYEIAQARLADAQAKLALHTQQREQLHLKLQNNSDLQSKIKDLSTKRMQIANDRGNILREIELYKTVSAMYSPTGAQAYILDSVIESFNERVAEYVNLLWSNVTYELKSYKETVKGDVTAKFSENLMMDNKPISIGSMSGGEFRALSLCVDFSLIDVMERRFGISLSPIILDEQFNDLDGAGRELVVELLGQFSTSRQVIVIDHASEVKSMFSEVINVEKRNEITTISLQT